MRDQVKLKLEQVFQSHSFCDLDKTSALAEVQYPQLLVTSTVSHPPKGSAARKSHSKQTEHRNSSAFVRHSWESSQYKSIFLHKQKLNTPLQYSNLPGLFRCKKAELFKSNQKTFRTLIEAMKRDIFPKISSSSVNTRASNKFPLCFPPKDCEKPSFSSSSQ